MLLLALPLLLLPPDDENGLFGAAVCGPGDVDGDGAADLLVGAGGVDGTDGAGGYVRAVSGASGETLHQVATPGDGFLREWDTLGHGPVLCAVGDVDADGTPDYAVGSQFASAGEVERAGVVRVHAGTDGALLWGRAGAGAFGHFGAALAARDLDDDGRFELAVGAPGRRGRTTAVADLVATAPTSMSWHAYALSGAEDRVLHELDAWSAGSHFGCAAAAVGDTDGDGVGDLLIGGATLRGRRGFDGYARLFSGATGARRLHLRAPR